MLRLGALIDNISEATLTGIKVGVGLTVAAGQLPKLLGIAGDPDADNFFAEVARHHRRPRRRQLGDGGVLRRDARRAPRREPARPAAYPAPLLAVVLGIVLVSVASIDEHGIALIAPVPSGLPTPVAPSFDHVGALAPGAFAIAIMCFLETARRRRRRAPPPRSRRSTTTRSSPPTASPALPERSSGRCRRPAGSPRRRSTSVPAPRTQVSELVTALLAVACALFLGGVLSDLPQATLGCMVVVAVLGLIKPAELRAPLAPRPHRVLGRGDHRRERAVLRAARRRAVGVALTLFLVIYELDRLGVTELQPTSRRSRRAGRRRRHRAVDGLLILRFDGPLYTANVRGANRKILAAVDAAHPTTLVLDAVGRRPVCRSPSSTSSPTSNASSTPAA